ncbi:phenylacetate--CoA ligase PaaK [Verminephrobacter eiseniae]|uniref:Phenylacetate-coenzyme A ligase n=1 Tax=Verminephrobacter eiseniae (strain EF01-2) TaxID=391735 RepID=A1WPU4_VEREI|nr:phenylacetate--CoA ligase PaaK [Verminephrobacter eiseniae]ABM59651.1 phenylacetate-CoA ligase [Verminephrobacter eiseniae EF01-2]MCW5285167.1 phenylacetate--CoA ligase [Verminephrobacter eiseniae]MCW5302875.1 phenylacetate--CoA ligase [Verminephrobacter eiseniae]MCW8181012.1 phenylacetate--CoA ligase [Verminephrobacter eiseniae]MCW8192726.1 phenylacetate--CoA ligase [Verminephrobacter eiseniae]
MAVRQPAPAALDPMESASRDAIEALQLQRLRWTLQHAYDNVAHYRRAFDARGVLPGDLKHLSDLAGFPFTVKQDLRDNYPFGMFAVPRAQLLRLHASSGTTGKPTVVGYTRQDIDHWADLVARSIRAAGGRPGDLVHVAYGYGLFTGGLGAHYGAERAGCTVVPMSGGQTEKQVQLIHDLQPRIIMVTPSYMQIITEEFLRQGLDPRASSLQIGIFGAEPWTEAMRREIEAGAGIDALDIYGLSEVMGPGVASECVESKDGPVVWEDHFYPEIIDPDSGQVLPDGQPGELVLTSLSKQALPMIRYRTRDLTRLLPPTSRSMRRIGKIVGRSDDMLIIRGVNLFPTQIEEIVLHSGRLSGHYQILVTRAGHLDQVTVRCELQPGLSADLPAGERQALADAVQQRIKTLVGISCQVQVLAANAIERTLVGKARRVIDQRPR